MAQEVKCLSSKFDELNLISKKYSGRGQLSSGPHGGVHSHGHLQIRGRQASYSLSLPVRQRYSPHLKLDWCERGPILCLCSAPRSCVVTGM